MSTLRIWFIVFALICCVTACSKLAYEENQGVTTIPDAQPVIEIIDLDNNLSIIHDHETGCQYILVSKYRQALAITPRVNTDGTQVCLTQAGIDEWNEAFEQINE